MKHILLTMLGKGQGKLEDNLNRKYKTTKYYHNNPDKVVEVPFVGEAIINICNKHFDEIHIFGTSQSMWEVLFWDCVDGNADEEKLECLYKIDEAVKNNKILPGCEELKFVETEFSKKYSIATFCHRIEIGKNEAELWSNLMSFANLKFQDCEISIDITHGLRFQPFFLFLSVIYYSILTSSVKFGSIYYGALELSANNLTPIYDFKQFFEFVEWINAAKTFDNTGNAQDLAVLIDNYTSKNNLAGQIEDFSINIQLNKSNKILQQIPKLNKLVNYISDNDYCPLRMLKPLIQENISNLLNNNNKWQAILQLSITQFNQRNYGFSVILLWNALLERIALSINVKLDKKNYIEISELATQSNDLQGISEDFKFFRENNNFLRKIRNNIAHYDDEIDNFTNKEIISKLREFILYYNELFYNDDFDKIKYYWKK